MDVPGGAGPLEHGAALVRHRMAPGPPLGQRAVDGGDVAEDLAAAAERGFPKEIDDAAVAPVVADGDHRARRVGLHADRALADEVAVADDEARNTVAEGKRWSGRVYLV